MGWSVADLTSVAAILAAVGGALLMVRGKTAGVWRENYEAEKARGDRLEQEVAELRLRVDRLEAENTTLRDVISARSAVDELREVVTANHRQLVDLIGGIDGGLRMGNVAS